MALHRAEQIITAITTLVTGLTTTGVNVERGRVYPFAKSTGAALTVRQGADDPLDFESQSYDYLDSVLTVIITAHVKSIVGNVESQLNQIRKEVHIALAADYKLGLSSFVIDSLPGGVDAPELSGESEKPSTQMNITWHVKYRSSRTDPSA